MGRQWAIMRNMPDFKNPDPYEGVLSIKFSAFLEMNNVFFKISMFCTDNSEEKATFSLESSYLTLDLTIPCDRRTVFKKMCRWSFRPTQISSTNYNLFLATAVALLPFGIIFFHFLSFGPFFVEVAYPRRLKHYGNASIPKDHKLRYTWTIISC